MKKFTFRYYKGVKYVAPNNAAPLNHGDTVEIEGKLYTVRVLGDFSDPAIFDPV